MKIKELIQYLELVADPALQESYDNSGLQCGQTDAEILAVMICLDITEEVLDEAIEKGCNLVISHHPLLFKALKQITNQNMTARCITKAIKNNLTIYSAHTNLDNISHGVSFTMAEKLNLKNLKILRPLSAQLKKLVTFVPTDYADAVRTAMFEAGAGHIGHYDQCSFNLQGEGTFRAGKESNPFVGKMGQQHHENETRIEMIMPAHVQKPVINAMIEKHPYEEVAYDIYPLENINAQFGAGLIGELENSMSPDLFLKNLKDKLRTNCIRHTSLPTQPIKRVALCGGAGSFLLNDAIHQKADIFISADFRYHSFLEADNRITIADIGHYESEQFAQDLLQQLITRKFRTFAVHLTSIITNPVIYF